MKFGKAGLVALAREIYEGNNFEEDLRKLKNPFLKKLETKLWNDAQREFPERDFTLGKETRTRANNMQKLKTVLKCE